MMVNKMIEIRGEPQTNPEVCRFIAVGRDVYPGGSYLCQNAENAKGAPLLESLFAIPGISQVWVSGNSVTIQKSSDALWTELGQRVGTALRAQLQSGHAFAPPSLSSAKSAKPARPELTAREFNTCWTPRSTPASQVMEEKSSSSKSRARAPSYA